MIYDNARLLKCSIIILVNIKDLISIDNTATLINSKDIQMLSIRESSKISTFLKTRTESINWMKNLEKETNHN